MLKQQLISLNDKDNWNAQLQNIPHSPAHTWAYNHAIALSSQLETYLYCATAENFKAICPIAIREKMGHKDIVTLSGFGGLLTYGKYPNFHRAYKEFLTLQGFICGYVALHPVFCDAADLPKSEASASSQIYTLDLGQSQQSLLQQLDKTHRYELRKWKNSDVKLNQNQAYLKNIFPKLYQETLIRINASHVYHFTSETLFHLLNSDNVLLIGAEINNHIEAISCFSYTPHIAEYFLNASSIDGRQHTRGLLWAGIETLQTLNVPILNLGGGIKPDDNLDNFKKRFGGKKHIYYALKQIYNEFIFNDLCKKLNFEPLSNYHYFPPYYTQ